LTAPLKKRLSGRTDRDKPTSPTRTCEERRPASAEIDGRSPAADVQGYAAFVAELKQRIFEARLRAARSVNRELVLLYWWGIGRDILSHQENEG
jgi:hypothetical protein